MNKSEHVEMIIDSIMAQFKNQFTYYATNNSISLKYLTAEAVLNNAKSRDFTDLGIDVDFDDLAIRFGINEELNSNNYIAMLYHSALSSVFDDKSSLVSDLEDSCELRYGYRHFHSALQKKIKRNFY